MAPIATSTSIHKESAVNPSQSKSIVDSPPATGVTTNHHNLSSISDSHLDYNHLNPSTCTLQSRQQFIHQLRQCLVGVGFFYLHNSPLNPMRDAIFHNSQQFFNLPSHVRNSINMENSRHFRGYSRFGDERTLGKVDHRDQIDFGPEATPLPGSITSKYSFANLIGENQFLPSEILPNHRTIVLDWFEACHQLSLELTDAFEEALGLKQKGRLKDYLVGQGNENGNETNEDRDADGTQGEVEMKYGRMKTIRYPTGESVDGIQRLESGGSQGVGAHKDGGWLTLLSTSPVKGLEVQNLDGSWLEVPHIEGSIIVNFGQQLEFLSRGMINAATHRVISNNSGADRLSVAWFATPKLNSKLIELRDEEIGEEFKEVWKAEMKRRKEEFGEDFETVKSDVKEKDLHSFGKFFGETAWEGLCRSHPNVVKRWYSSS